MATAKQIEANQKNAKKSTGPRTEAGKAKSRKNALKHGMAGTGLVVAEALGDAFDDRRDRWADEIRPRSDESAFALDRCVAASLQIEECEIAHDRLVIEQVSRARLNWESDRRTKAAGLMSRLAKDPMLVTCQLEATRQGAEMMIAVWNRLGEAIEANGGWSEDEASTALDLLGVPARLRAGRTPLDPRGGIDPRAHRRTLVIDECARLTERIATALDELDTIERGTAETAGLVVLSPEGLRLQRYERDAWRRFRESIRAAKAVSTESETEVKKDVEPIAAPKQPVVDRPPVEASASESDEPTEDDRDMDLYARLRDRADQATTSEEYDALLAEAEAALIRVGTRRGYELPPSLTEPEPDPIIAPAPIRASRPMNRRQRRAQAALARRA